MAADAPSPPRPSGSDTEIRERKWLINYKYSHLIIRAYCSCLNGPNASLRVSLSLRKQRASARVERPAARQAPRPSSLSPRPCPLFGKPRMRPIHKILPYRFLGSLSELDKEVALVNGSIQVKLRTRSGFLSLSLSFPFPFFYLVLRVSTRALNWSPQLT